MFLRNIYIYIIVIYRSFRQKLGSRAKIIRSFDPNKQPEGFRENLSKELYDQVRINSKNQKV